MKAVLLAGGLGTRLSEETTIRPKPMVEIGNLPILWHIMKIYSAHGINDFVICAGYKGWIIKEFFSEYFLRMSDVTFDLRSNTTTAHGVPSEPWKVTVVDTGEKSMTGGRLRRIREYLDDEPFCMTYGDGLSDVDISALIRFHRDHGKLATLTATQPEGRFGMLSMSHDHDPAADPDTVHAFKEKPNGDGGWVNGGFFVLDPKVLDYVEGDMTVWEGEPLQRLAAEGELKAFRHVGFWQPMDTLRDKSKLEDLWKSGNPPWKVW